jgi:hypothetical protein
MKSKNWLSFAIGAVVAVVLFAPLPTFAKGHAGGGGGGTSTGCSGKGGQSFGVTSIISGTTSDPFQLLSDGKGTWYTTYKNSRTDSVTSEIQGTSCDWVLDLSNSASRTVQLSLINPYSTPDPVPSGWPNDGSFVPISARIITACEANIANTNGSVYGLSVGNMKYGDNPLQCGLWIKFYSNGFVYGLSFNAAKYAEATWAKVACQNGVAGPGSQCNSWTVTPGLYADGLPATLPGTNQNTAVGELIQPSCDGCSSGEVLGLYYVDFSAMITNP